MNRRLHALSRDPLYFILLNIFLVFFHIEWQTLSDINITFYPLTFITLVFVGYKYGKLNCAIASLIAFLSCIAIKLFFKDVIDTDINENYSLFFSSKIDFNDLALIGQSIGNFITLGLLALFATAIIDLFERCLQSARLSVDELLPYDRYFYLEKIINFFHFIFVTKTENVSTEAEMNITLPYGVKINLKVLFKQILLLLSIPLIFLINLNVNIVIGEYLDIQFLPFYSAVIILLIFAWFRGFTKALWLTIFIVIATLITQVTIEGGSLTESIYFYPTFSNLSIVVLTLISAWWLCRFKAALDTPSLKRRLFRIKLFRNLKKSPYKMNYFPIGCALLLFLFSLQFQVEISALAITNSPTEIEHKSDESASKSTLGNSDVENSENLNGETIAVSGYQEPEMPQYVFYNSFFILAALCLYFCSKYNPYSISNTLLILLSVQNFFVIYMESIFEEPHWFLILLNTANAIEIFILTAIPICFRFLYFKTHHDLRVLFYSLTFALMFLNTLSSQLQNSFILALGMSPAKLLLSLLLHVILIEFIVQGLSKALKNKTIEDKVQTVNNL